MSVADKKKLLEATGFREDVSGEVREGWFNRSDRKRFSHDVLRDHDANWLEARLHEQVPPGQFWFYFNFPPETLDDCNKILVTMNLTELVPVVRASFSKRTSP
jgi:hypothetical protein